MSYRRDRCFEHYGYQAKTLRVMCTRMLVAVREWYKDCVLGRMSHVELYGTLVATFGATQPVETPTSTQAGDTNGNGGF
jgi:hypothetical protein